MEVSYCRIKMHFFSIAFFEKHKIDGKRNNAKCLRIIRVIVELRRRLRLRISAVGRATAANAHDIQSGITLYYIGISHDVHART